jgi:predicted amidohydrolase
MTKLSIACVQVNADTNMARNVEIACDLVRQAADAGADLIGLPENVALMAASEEERLENAYRPAEHPALKAFADVAREKGVWLQAGSVAALRTDGSLANHAFLFDDQGRTVADYEKIHMFDVDLPDGSRYRESSMFNPGDQAVLASTPWGGLGMTICYDLRFPHLYRDLARAGAAMLTCPAAFTKVTGDAHWEVLLRARAIECGAFVFPACTDALNGCRFRFAHDQVFIGQHAQMVRDGIEQFTRTKQEIRVAGFAERLVAQRESLIDQQPARRHGVNDCRKQGPVEVVGHNDRFELPCAQGPW